MDATPGETSQAVVKERKRHSLLVDLFIRIVKEKPLGLVGGVIVLVLFFVGIFADFLAPYGFNELDMAARLEGPSPNHILGCDNVGRDIFSRIIYGARLSMVVGLGATTIATIGSLLLGTISGYLGGKVDLAIQRVNDAVQAIPTLILLLTIIAVIGPGLLQVVLALGGHAALTSRRERSYVIAIKENIYFEAARAIGVPTTRILMKHVVPNIFPMVIIAFSISLGRMIMAEATMSFLGFGIPPPMPSWGGMLSGSGRRYMIIAPGLAVWPGLTLAIVIWGINMLGDAVRDILDPRLRGGLGRYGGVTKKLIKAKAKAAGLTKQ
ncbi:ABC transporter permease [Chloroflexota bacterium]